MSKVTDIKIRRHGVDTTGELPPGTTGGDGGGTMEARIAKLESDVEYIKRDVAEIKTDLREIKSEFPKLREEMSKDFRLLLFAGLGATVFVLGILAHGFKWI